MMRVGIGGWVYEPWRGVFYPKGLSHAQELAHASRELTSIEINGTFYGSQKPESFRRWAEETPDDFVFSVKGPRYATHRKVLAEAGESIERFFGSGVLELKSKLGPVLWQMPPTKPLTRTTSVLSSPCCRGGSMAMLYAMRSRFATQASPVLPLSSFCENTRLRSCSSIPISTR
jgi:uncharacterized protein YecE (DUF72 family)